MKTGLLLVWIVIVVPPPYAQAQAQYSLQPEIARGIALPDAYIGTWGSAAQCADTQATHDGDAGRSAYEISVEWIRQGKVYCHMTWYTIEMTARGGEVHALAQCGEDGLREYRVVLRLAQARLWIDWSPDFTTPALRACRRD